MMIDTRGKAWALIGGTFLVGVLAWCGLYYTMIAAVFFPALWSLAPTRCSAGAVAFAYYLGGTHALFVSSNVYFGYGTLCSAALWSLGPLLLATVWGLLWCKNPPQRGYFAAAALLLTAVPPLGIIGWVHPVTAAGVLFPGLGLLGLSLCFALATALASVWTSQACRGFSLACALVALIAHGTAKAIPIPEGWIGCDTEYKNNAAQPDLLQQYRQQVSLLSVANRNSGTVLFPEISSGVWSDVTGALWMQSLKDQQHSALLGAVLPDASSRQYHNVIVGVENGGWRILYYQRMPSVASMWKPWADDGCIAHWFQSPVFEWKGKKVAGLVCHEQFLVWTVVQTLFCQPDLIAASGSVWWARKTTLPASERAIVRAWSALSGIPVITAFNH